MYGAIYLGLNATVESARYVVINGLLIIQLS